MNLCHRFKDFLTSHRAVIAMTLVLVMPFSANAQPFPPDPVDELLQALPVRQEDRRNPSDVVLQYRKKTLQERIDALKTIGELARALKEWPMDNAEFSPVQETDREFRTRVGTRLQQALKGAVQKGDRDKRLAAASLIAEMSPDVRAVDQADRGGYGRSLTPLVLTLTRDEDIAVRLEALRALGAINPDPKPASKILQEVLLHNDNKVARQTAAFSLKQMVVNVLYLNKE